MQRNLGLDILRTFSIFLVLFQHAGISIQKMVIPTMGAFGVEIFFVLSGFLIGDILIRQLQKENSLKSIKTFLFRRWLRILPTYYFVLIFKFLFIDHSIGLNIIYYFLFLQNNFYGIQFHDVTWSLVIEEWFYIFLPLFLTLFFKLNGKQFKTGMFYFLAFIIAETVLRLIYVQVKGGTYSAINGIFLLRFDALFMGVILAYLKNNYFDVFKKLNSIWLSLLAFGLIIGYLFFINNRVEVMENFNNSVILKVAHFIILPFLISLIVPKVFFSSIDWVGIKLKTYLTFCFTNLSKLTYSLYLVHPFFYFLNDHFNPVLSKILYFIFTFVSAFLLYNLIEKPILKIRDKKIKE